MTTAIIDVLAGWLTTLRSPEAGEFDRDDDAAGHAETSPSPLEEFY